MKSTYPAVSRLDDLLFFAREITRLREIEDLPDFNNLRQVFVGGRSTTRVPSGPTDVVATDQLGDIVYDATYQYTLVDDSGTLKWDRRALDVSW